jgi:uncharacterized protein with HEPN domain
MRADDLYLVDILEAGDRLQSYLGDVSVESFRASKLLYSATLAELIIMGEAAARLSAQTRAQAPGVPWEEIRGFRNLAVHGYFALDTTRVWEIATVSVRNLHGEAGRLLLALFPETHREYLRRRAHGGENA